MRLLLLIVLTSLLSTTFFSCFSVKSQSKKGGGKDYEIFYLGDNVDQYFIKPLTFKSESGKLILDITFRHPMPEDHAIVNFTLATTSRQSQVQKINFRNTEVSHSPDQLPELLFTEQDDKENEFSARYTTLIPTNHILKLLTGANWEIELEFSTSNALFRPVRASQRAIDRLIDNPGAEINKEEIPFFKD